MDSRNFWGYGVLDFSPCPAGTPRRDDRPPTHFFVKKKFIPIGGTKSTTQKVPSVFCYARDFLCRVKRCATHGIPQSGIPPGGGITAMPHTFRRNVWERGPPSDQRDDGGGRIPSGAQSTRLHIPIGRAIPAPSLLYPIGRPYPSLCEIESGFLPRSYSLRYPTPCYGRNPPVRATA